tara:strand:+ start:652 stop:909 length:258 start_codon:yes stop_codon:yes gene_type:complete
MTTYDQAVDNYISSITGTKTLLKQLYLKECTNLSYDKWLKFQEFTGRVKLPVDPRRNPIVSTSSATNSADLLLEIEQQAQLRFEC